MFIGHTISSARPNFVTLYSKENSDILGYRSNDGIQIEEVGTLTQAALQELIHSRKEVENLCLKTIIEEPVTCSRPRVEAEKYAIFEKRIVMTLIKFFTVHEFRPPMGDPVLEQVDRDLNKQLMTWDMDVSIAVT